jgi:hypothetical protein
MTKQFKKTIAVISVAILHFVLTIVTMLFAMGIGMAEFDNEIQPSRVDDMLMIIFQVLSFPAYHLMRYTPLLVLGAPFFYIANGIFWGYVIVSVYGFVRSRLRKSAV